MMKFLHPLCLAAIGAMLLARVSYAADSFTPGQQAEIVSIMRNALVHDPSILRDAVAALQADETRRAQADQQAIIAAHRDTLVTPQDPVAGNPNGDVTIVEFYDVRCPYCRRLEPVMEKLLSEDHSVRLVFKDLPILGPPSVLGAKAVLAAQKQGAYNSLREAVMRLPANITLAMIKHTAENLGLNWTRLKGDMNAPSIQKHIDEDLRLAQALKIQGTPTLVIGNTLIPGAVDLSELRKLVTEQHEAN